MTSSPLHSWTPQVDVDQVTDLIHRLKATRFSPQLPLPGWSAGTAPTFLRRFVAEWADGLDVAELQEQLDHLPGYRVSIDDLDVYLLHYRSAFPESTPVLAIHGWPSSVLEYTSVAARLSQGELTLVIPALPGFPFSEAPPTIEDYAAARIAERYHHLMLELGYSKYLVTGGDIGARVATWLGAMYPASVIGLHVSSNALEPTEAACDSDGSHRPASPAESAWIRARNEWAVTEGAYMHVHQTKPATLAPALSDSPSALASWVIEKWYSWGAADVEGAARRRYLQLLCTLYWLSNTGASSILPYYAYELAGGSRAPAEAVAVPVAFYLAEGEIGGVPPKSLAARRYDLRRWTVLPEGGHFPALDTTDLFISDLAGFAREVCS